ncbi:MAG: PTS sugar transporter subunit IIB [Sphaerochaetaceae bacterium]|jgi:PTS system ascorbate-specific IIB component|nr:PTS sugar transporter subunit IIB [Sphaerochaetaceae bacterium]MDC7238533.1 PTS sugar transporter subunit IIB [Sphaerochaetaceae bacterium]MDC7248821.1 PTS sugar transporter subunit IIB [Sphaerochaetaceae bacterium]
MIKILAVCGNGMGTSLVIKLKVKKFVEANNIKCQIDSCSLGQAKGFISQGVDIVLLSSQLASGLGTVPPRTHVLALKNLMDDKEFGPKILDIVEKNYPEDISK